MALKRFKNWKGVIGSRKGVFMACVGVCVALGAFFGGVDMAKADWSDYIDENSMIYHECVDDQTKVCISFIAKDDFFLKYGFYGGANNYWLSNSYAQTTPYSSLIVQNVTYCKGGSTNTKYAGAELMFDLMSNIDNGQYSQNDFNIVKNFSKDNWVTLYPTIQVWDINDDSDYAEWSYESGGTWEVCNVKIKSGGASWIGFMGENVSDIEFDTYGTMGSADPNVEVTSPANNQDVTESFLLWFETSDVDLDKWDVVIATVVGVDNKNFEIFRKTFWRDVNSESESFPIRMESMGVGEYTIIFEFVDFSTGERFQTDTEFGWSVISYVTGFDDDFLPFSETDQFDNFSGSGFYETYSSYDEPTPMYSKITSLIDPVANWIGRNVQTLSQTFERDVAKNQGAKMTQGIVLVRYYSNSFNDLFGGFPLGDAFISLMFFMIIVACIRLVLAIKKMAK